MKIMIISKETALKCGIDNSLINMYKDIKPVHNYFGMDCYVDSNLKGDKAFIVNL